MTTSNHWGTYRSSLVVWRAELPSWLLRAPAELLGLADALLEFSSREEVLCVDEVPWSSPEDLELYADAAPTARVSVFGPAGVEERRVHDLGAELLTLRPDLAHVPHVPALSVSGPDTLYRSKPPYLTISLHTDIWFPRVVGINEDDCRFYDNSPLAERHTPRLNRFLADIREAAEAIGAGWSHEVDNPRYRDQVTDSGIVLDQTINADRVAHWGARICAAAATDPVDMLFELGIPGAVAPRSSAHVVEPPPPGITELRLVERDGGFARLEARLTGSTLTRAHLDDRLGPGADVPRVHPGREFSVSYPVDVPGAPYGCVVFAEFVDEPLTDTPACAVMLRRDPSRRPTVKR